MDERDFRLEILKIRRRRWLPLCSSVWSWQAGWEPGTMLGKVVPSHPNVVIILDQTATMMHPSIFYFCVYPCLVFLLPFLFLLLQTPADSLPCCSHNSISFGKTRSADMLGWIRSSVDAPVTRLWELDDITGKTTCCSQAHSLKETFQLGNNNNNKKSLSRNKCRWHFTLYIFQCQCISSTTSSDDHRSKSCTSGIYQQAEVGEALCK